MPYRSDEEALSNKRAELETKRVDAEKRSIELAGTRAELAATERTIAAGGTPPDVMTLDAIRIAAPCPADWFAMKGDARVRYCGECKKNVFNLSAMSNREATDFVRARTGEVCVRFYKRRDGRMMTTDCAPGVRKRRRVRVALAFAATAISATGLSGVAAFSMMGARPISPMTGAIDVAPTTPTVMGSVGPIDTPTPPDPPAPSVVGSVGPTVAPPPAVTHTVGRMPVRTTPKSGATK